MNKYFHIPHYVAGKTACLILFAGLFLFMHTSPAATADSGRPLNTKGPTEVQTAVFVLDLDEVNNVSQSFDANIYYELRWQDPRLAHDGPGEVTRPLTEIWNPRIQIINQQKIWSTLPEIVEISPTGDVTYQQRVWGSFSQPLALKDFPFDRQFFNLQFASIGNTPKEVVLISDPTAKSGIATQFSLADWTIINWKGTFAPFATNLSEDTVSGFLLSIEANRKYGYFVIKVIIPLLLIVMMSWVVFLIDPKESGTQINVAITTMLTLIAYRFAVGTDLPKVSYLTRLDYFILVATFLVFASLVEVVVTSEYAKIGELKRARLIDRWARILFPLTFIAVCLQSFIFGF